MAKKTKVNLESLLVKAAMKGKVRRETTEEPG